MVELSRQDLGSILETLQAIHAELDLDGFAEQAVAALCALVACDLAVFVVIDRASRRLLAYAQRPELAQVPDLRPAYRRYIRDRPMHSRPVRTGTRTVLQPSHATGRAGLLRRSRYRDMYRPLGLKYQMCYELPSESSHVALVELSRRTTDFSDRDRLVLDLLRPHLIQALQAASAFSSMQERAAMLTRAVEALGLLVLTPALRIQGATVRAQELFARFFQRRPDPEGELPEAVVRWIRAEEHESVVRQREPLVINRDEQALLLRLVHSHDHLLLMLEELAQGQHLSGYRALGLTQREAEVLALASEGKGNTAIAQVLGLSPRTVGKHLEHIYAKLGVASRGAAIATALARRTPPWASQIATWEEPGEGAY